MTNIIEFKDVSLKFSIFSNPSPTLKEALLNMVSRRQQALEGPQRAEFYALKNINLTIRRGERVGIIGLNGSGKSTLLKVVAGIYSPHTGRVIVRGKVTPLIELGAGINPEFSGRENIYLYGAIHGMSPQRMRIFEEDIIEFSELGMHIDVPAKYYSTGMYSRLIFSIASMTEPEILIVDEVFAAGDARFIDKAIHRMVSLFQQSQAVLFVSHNLDQVREICNRVIVLHNGEMINDGTPNEMIDFYRTVIVPSQRARSR
jgi:ABC-type polysaccharide/polyol phosphate transport system ATPase subunit